MKVEKVNIKELWFTEQLLYWNDIKDNKIKELEEENETLKDKYEKLKADYIKLSKIVEINWWYRASYVNELRDKIAKLEQELKIWMLTAKDYARLQWVDLEDSPRL